MEIWGGIRRPRLIFSVPRAGVEGVVAGSAVEQNVRSPAIVVTVRSGPMQVDLPLVPIGRGLSGLRYPRPDVVDELVAHLESRLVTTANSDDS